jgi:hypothetical protein
MIVASAASFLQAFSRLDSRSRAVPKAVFLIEPEEFGLEPQSAADNAYMRMAASVDPDRALAQHRGLVRAIRRAGIPVFVLPGIPEAKDGVFLNNVFGTAEGRFVIGSMRHEARRREAARKDVRALFEDVLRYETIDLSTRDCVAELTGPLVIDRARAVGLCGMTPRVDDAGVTAMHDAFRLALTYRFPLTAGEYHTNVVLSILAARACVMHAASFADDETPEALRAAYHGATIELDDAEKANFAANCIALSETDVFLSATADRALRPATRARFAALGFTLHPVEVEELEKAGGSVRCLIAELF